MTDVSAEATPAEATTTAAEGAPRKGRPRPEITIARDEQVLALIAKSSDGLTRAQIAEELKLDGKTVYLSLFRLRRDGKADKGRNGTSHVWVATSTDANSSTE